MAVYNGGEDDDFYTGGEENDLINGGDGDDHLDGAGGDDVIDGGPGSNDLFGGDGSDTLYSHGSSDDVFGGAGADIIYRYGRYSDIDGGAGDNQIHLYGLLGGNVDGGLTPAEGGSRALSDLFFQDTRFDSTSGMARVLNFETVSGRLIGTDRNDSLYLVSLTADPNSGSALTIVAGRGDDSVDSSHVDDLIFGEDEFLGEEPDEPGNSDIIRSHGGDDVVYAGGGYDSIAGGDGNDRLYGGTGVDLVMGDAGDDVIWDGRYALDHVPDAQADRLQGWAGDDRIFGGYRDRIDGGTGYDSLALDLSNASEGVTADFRTLEGGETVTVGRANISRIEKVLSVVGSDYDDDLAINGFAELSGMDGNDRLSGSDADRDVISGDDGDDAVFGLGGDDRLRGGAGNDLIEGGGGADRLGYRGLSQHTEQGDDILDGGDGDDMIAAGRGDDLLIGGAGSDLLLGSYGNDTASYAGDGGPVRVRLYVSSPQSTLSSGTDTLSDIENLIGSEHDDELAGHNEANRLAGRDGDDELDGRGGADTLVGGIGADIMKGGTGGDFFIVSDSGDEVVEYAGEGHDTVMSTIDYQLAETLEDLRLAGTAVNGTGNGRNNAILGNRADNLIRGLDGHDELDGGAGDDALSGNAGRDILTGGAGRDTLTGGSGTDLYRFDDGDSAAAPGQADLIAGFSQASRDRIDLSAIDADTGSAADEGFAFIGGEAFSGAAGELRATVADGVTLVQGDVDGDGSADFTIRLDGPVALAATDFIL